MLRVCTLFSGSSANCTLIEADGRAVLVDAGGGVRRTQSALNALGLSLDKIEAVFLTHEHSDHTAGLDTIYKYYKIPLISNEATLAAVKRDKPELDDSLFCPMPSGACAKKDDFEVTSFRSPHDSAECVGYRITTKYGSVGVLTDAGGETPEIIKGLSGCKLAVLEANHDKNMLLNGAYPYSLKQRIIGPYGHLSNDQSGGLLQRLVASGTEKVLLAHLSKDNNTPETALATVTTALFARGIKVGNDVRICVCPRSEISEIYTYEK